MRASSSSQSQELVPAGEISQQFSFGELIEFTSEFSFADLIEFTSDFSTKIGSGGSAEVYKGEFSDGVKIAVKLIKVEEALSKIFKHEMRIMLRISHPYIVKFYGFCFSKRIQALVFEYMENESLDRILYDGNQNGEWERFYDITVKTAEGLSYLHHDCQPQIFHYDIKPANILLDSSFSPKIGDFGLAKLLGKDKILVTDLEFEGTRGYAAPETGQPFSEVTCKCDVYSFGIMLFNILRRRSNQRDETWFPKVVWENLEGGDLDRIIKDCEIEDKNIEKATILMMVGLWCVQHTPETRPSMMDVVRVLLHRIAVDRPPDPEYKSNREMQISTLSI